MMLAACHSASESRDDGDLALPPGADLAGADFATAPPDLTPCTPTCGTAVCGSDGCGGSCGQCPNPQWCGGGGVTGQCGSSSTIPAYPGVTPMQVDTGAAFGLRVAPDEAHVLVQRTLITTGPEAYDSGALAVVAVDNTGAGHARDLTTLAEFINGQPQADFNADSTGLWFIDISSSPPRLQAANSDGTNLRTLATGGIQYTSPAKNTLVWVLNSPNVDTRGVYAVTLPSGTPVTLAAQGAITYPQIQTNPTGSTVLITNEGNTLFELAQTATGATTPLQGTQLRGFTWSPDGGHLAYVVPGSGSSALRVISADGTSDVQIAAVVATDPIFSPDGKRIAYGELKAGGYLLGDIRVHPLAGGADVVLTVDNHYWEQPTFSADGGLIVVQCQDPSGGTAASFAVAPTDHSGAFTTLASNIVYDSLGTPPFLTPAHDYAAIDVVSRKVTVAPTAGGATRTLPIPVDYPGWYEPVAANPKLAVFTSPTESLYGIPGSVVLFPADGSGSGITLPGAAYADPILSQAWHFTSYGWQDTNGNGGGEGDQPFAWGWLGSEMIYEANHGENNLQACDVIAATDDGVTVGVIASGVSRWSVHDGAKASRVFFGRAAQDGVWMSPVPQTPGR